MVHFPRIFYVVKNKYRNFDLILPTSLALILPTSIEIRQKINEIPTKYK